MATAIAVMIGRFVLLGVLLTLASLEGALPLLVMALGVLIARSVVVRKIREIDIMTSPLASVALFHLGPVPITEGVVATWAIMAVLVIGGVLVTRRLSLVPSRTQAVFELIVDTVDGQIRDTMRLEPAPYRAFIGTLFVFIFVANWSSLIPGVEPPTAHLETDAALALLVFLAVIWFGIRAGGVRGYLATFASPSPIMIPLNFVESLTRTFSLLVRLFGNVMSGVFMIGIVLIARRPAGSDPADGARSADRRRAGLHLRDPRDGLHRRRGRRDETRPEHQQPKEPP